MKLFLMLENEEITEDNLSLIGKLANNKPEKRQETPSVAKEEEKVEEVVKKEEKAEEERKKYTLDDVKKKLIEVQQKKGTRMAKDVLDIFGCSKLSDVPEKEYNDLMKIIEEALE